ncbi:MAG: hypothetical protein QOF61_3367 [Acidobacteriota bacterium]|jgi:hypothetical protein|nr:hypothetical protein [Acidobacteriota bacterium]
MSADRYEKEGYAVKDIRVETPLDFIGLVKRPLEATLRESLTSLQSSNRGLKVGEKFSNMGYTDLLSDLTSKIGTLEPGERFKFVGTVPSLQSCDAGAKSLEVVFHVVTSGPISYVASIFEKRHDRLTRELAPGAFSRLTGKFLPQPYMGYNRSRALFGGTKASYKFEDDFINKVDMSVSGSGSSATGDVALAGDRDFKTGLINHAEWRFGYRYANIPSDPVRLKDATGVGQIFGATRPLGNKGIILRFGSSVEGGNRQTDLAQSSLPPTVAARSGYGAAKMYVGGTLNQGRQAWTASYGLQLGGNGDLQVDYVKQIADTSYTVRFLPREHLPLRLDAQFNAGDIHSASGTVPVNERFFGGNLTREFIQGDEWRIRSSPFIRSFPQNRLNLIAPGLPIGGESFFSANLTVAQTVWSRPAIPSDILRDVRVRQALGGQLAGSRLFAISSYQTETPQFAALKANLKGDVDKLLAAIQQDLQKLNPPPDSIPIDLDEFAAQIVEARNIIAEKEVDEDTGKVSDSPLEFRHIRSLALGFNGQPETSKIGAIIATIRDDILPPLQDAGLIELHDSLKGHNDKLEASRQAVQVSYDEIAKLVAINPEELREAQAGLGQVGARLDKLGTILDDIEQRIGSLPTETKQEIQDAVDRTRSYVDTSKASVTAAGGADPDIAKNNLQLLAVGFGSVAPPMLVEVRRYVGEMQAPLAKGGLSAQGQLLAGEAGELPRLRAQIRQGLKRVTVSEIERRALNDVAYTARILDVTFRELNLVSVSPVAMFDAARIGARTIHGDGGTRYGVGGGLRLSVVSLDLTAGYSWNTRRQAGEGRGAFVFSLDISDLFR